MYAKKMKKLFLTIITWLGAVGMMAQHIDFDISGKTSQALQEGFTEWVVPEGVSDTKEVDGITITIAAAQGSKPMDPYCEW